MLIMSKSNEAQSNKNLILGYMLVPVIEFGERADSTLLSLCIFLEA